MLGVEDEESLREAKTGGERPLRDVRAPSAQKEMSGSRMENSKEDGRDSRKESGPRRMEEDIAIAQRVMDRRREPSKDKDGRVALGALDPKGTHGALRRKDKGGKVALGALDPEGTHGALRGLQSEDGPGVEDGSRRIVLLGGLDGQDLQGGFPILDRIHPAGVEARRILTTSMRSVPVYGPCLVGNSGAASSTDVSAPRTARRGFATLAE